MFLCCKDFQESRGEDRERFSSSHRCGGKVGKSGHGAWCDTMSEGQDTTRKAGKISRESTFGRGLLQSQGETWYGLEEIACLRSGFAFGTWIQSQAAGKSGKMWEVLAEAEWESSGARATRTRPWPHFCTPREIGKEGGRCLIPEIWDLKPGRMKAQQV